MYKANHEQQHSMFDNKQQMMLNSTNPKRKIVFIFFLKTIFFTL